MTTQYEDYIITMSRRGKNYKVQNIYDDEIIYVSADEVEEIMRDTYIGEENIIILLAIIEWKRKDCSTEKLRYRRVNKGLKISTLRALLKYFSFVDVLKSIEELNYHDIYQIFYSDDPIEELTDCGIM